MDSDSLIFGSAIAVEEYVVPRYKKFCPYAYKKDKVYAHDISLNYNYTDPSTEWYHTLRIKDWSNQSVSSNEVTYRYGSPQLVTEHAPLCVSRYVGGVLLN